MYDGNHVKVLAGTKGFSFTRLPTQGMMQSQRCFKQNRVNAWKLHSFIELKQANWPNLHQWGGIRAHYNAPEWDIARWSSISRNVRLYLPRLFWGYSTDILQDSSSRPRFISNTFTRIFALTSSVTERWTWTNGNSHLNTVKPRKEVPWMVGKTAIEMPTSANCYILL
jgi:hypothetical protein